MSERLVMGYWDCSQCSAKGIEGTKRECPHCGTPRGKDVTFYMKQNEKRYLTAEESKNKGKGEDWLCNFCETLNSATTTVCKSCGAERNSVNKTYSEIKKDEKKKEKRPDTSNVSEENFPTNTILPSSSKFSVQNILLRSIPILIASILLVVGIVFGIQACSPKTATFYVNDVQWETFQNVEVFKTLHKSGWTVPDGGRVTRTEEEIYEYEKVLDHYETVTKSRTKQVVDHYETKYDYVNNGDGTFTEKSRQEPVYRNETEYYTEKEPVYRKEPIYKTKYYYNIDKWVVDDTLTLSGSKGTNEIKYAEIEETEKKRAGSRDIKYTCKMTFVDNDKKENEKKTFFISEEIYQKLNKDKKVICKYWGSTIQEVLE